MCVQKLETFAILVSACLSDCLPLVCSITYPGARRYVCECCNSLAVLQQDETRGKKEKRVNKRTNDWLASQPASRPIEQYSTSHNYCSIKHIDCWVCMSGALVWVSSIWTIYSPWSFSFYTIWMHYACIIPTTFAFYYSFFEKVVHIYI
jgi:hypothetical protein